MLSRVPGRPADQDLLMPNAGISRAASQVSSAITVTPYQGDPRHATPDIGK